MKKIDKITLSNNSKIKEALTTISKGAMKIAVVLDKNKKLLGTLTDGDVRKGLLNGLNLNSPIKNIYYKNPVIANINDDRKKVLKLALSKKINQIPVIDDKKNVIGIHLIEELINVEKKNNRVVLMVGGQGTRLRPLTKNIPKSMLNVGNKPILETIIKSFSEQGFVNLILCVNYKSKYIQNYFGDGNKFGVNIQYIEEKKRMGTAGALRLINEKISNTFFVMNGDLLTNLDYEKILDFHNHYTPAATMCVKQNSYRSSYGEVTLDGENILSIDEKPVHNYFINAGIYVLEPECLDIIPNKFFDMTSLFKKLIKMKKKTVSFPLTDYWIDIGKIADYEKANNEYFKVF